MEQAQETKIPKQQITQENQITSGRSETSEISEIQIHRELNILLPKKRQTYRKKHKEDQIPGINSTKTPNIIEIGKRNLGNWNAYRRVANEN